ncbi:related to putative copper-activated transcription factor [Cephalotrichum gorgonifer]|uniref:Related to putative copper-activated transcription factor n=1 Tax=Cephalotrichum gorgonifer TaxID=2041049 RepID=A0AAE8N249_9PEZI|nr:related to putative copper-activated transcription factor [Cephalotrichum gorgonifer]
MPIINGLKMACEPCIRGHRSTKCNHANERLMVPVRKPGRPLSLCPHPPSRQCGCAGVTAAIPRKQTCHCGTSKPSAPKGSASPEEASPAPSDPSTKSPTQSGATPSSFRVQKASKPSRPSRKASIDPATLERMDASQIHIVPAYDARQQAQTRNGTTMHHVPAAAVNGYSSVPISPHHAGPANPMIYPFYPHQLPPSALDHSIQPSPGGAHPGSVSSQPSSSGHNPRLAPGPMSNHISAGPSSQDPNSGAEIPEPKKGSCCQPASPPSETKPMPGVGHGAVPHVQQASPGVMTPNMVPNQPPYSHPHTPYFSQPTIFTYPPHYGSYLHPLLPELWKQSMDSMTAQALGNPNTMGAPDLNFMATGTPTTPTLGSSHVCTCGSSCQCVGCAAHPYNEATQNYVRSAWNSMMGDAWGNGMTQSLQGSTQFHAGSPHLSDLNGGEPTNGRRSVASPVLGNGDTSISTAATPVAPETNRVANGGGCCGSGPEQTKAGTGPVPTTTSPSPQTPSDTASGTSEEQTLSASDFFFVTYPFGNDCMGDTASCPCGDDCQCLGCVVHGNPIGEGISGS